MRDYHGRPLLFVGGNISIGFGGTLVIDDLPQRCCHQGFGLVVLGVHTCIVLWIGLRRPDLDNTRATVEQQFVFGAIWLWVSATPYQSRGRFIQDQYLWISEQRSSDRYPLPLPSTQCVLSNLRPTHCASHLIA